MKKLAEIDRRIAEAEENLASLDSRRSTLLEQIKSLKRQRESILAQRLQVNTKISPPSVTNQSSSDDKVALFMSLLLCRTQAGGRC
jgi:chromosome segregation ATPase